MWLLIKQNILYNKWGYSSTIFYLIMILLSLALNEYVKTQIGEIQSMVIQDFASGVLMAILTYSLFLIHIRDIKEFRVRQSQLLPISKIKIAFSRMLFYLIPLIVLFLIIFTIYSFFYSSFIKFTGSVLLQIGFPLFLVALFLIEGDIKNTISTRLLKILIPFLSLPIFSYLTYLYFSNITYINTIIDLYAGGGYLISRMILLIFGIALSCVSIFTYSKRKNFTG